MNINLDLLKFHYFRLDKNIHNLINKKFKDYFDKLFFNKQEQSLKIVLEKVKQLNNFLDLTKTTNHIHKIIGINKEMIITVIEKQHPNLHFELSQLFENISLLKVDFYQLKLINECRLVFILKQTKLNKTIFVPILFDINHCFYLSKNKNFDKGANRDFKWDLREDQQELKRKLIN